MDYRAIWDYGKLFPMNKKSLEVVIKFLWNWNPSLAMNVVLKEHNEHFFSTFSGKSSPVVNDDENDCDAGPYSVLFLISTGQDDTVSPVSKSLAVPCLCLVVSSMLLIVWTAKWLFFLNCRIVWVGVLLARWYVLAALANVFSATFFFLNWKTVMLLSMSGAALLSFVFADCLFCEFSDLGSPFYYQTMFRFLSFCYQCHRLFWPLSKFYRWVATFPLQWLLFQHSSQNLNILS